MSPLLSKLTQLFIHRRYCRLMIGASAVCVHGVAANLRLSIVAGR